MSEALTLLLAERERRRRQDLAVEIPKWDWFGPDCGCPDDARKEDGSCPIHPRAREKQRVPEGEWSIWYIESGRGWGKALSLDTPLPTPDGWTTMGKVAVGDTLFDERGWPCKVTYVSEVQLGRDCYNVVFSDGSVIKADADHQWVTWTHSMRKASRRRVAPEEQLRDAAVPRSVKPEIVTTQQIRDSLLHGRPSRRESNHSIPLAGALQCPEADLPIDPYVLGLWLGDGTSTGASIATNDPEIIESIFDAGYEARKGREPFMWSIPGPKVPRDSSGRFGTNGGLHSRLKALGLLGNKHIPRAYFRGSTEQRTALLMGLMDTDGTIGKSGSCCFDNTNKGLAEGAAELAVGLGFKVTQSSRVAKLGDKECGICYRVKFTPHLPVFRLPRKLERQRLGDVRATQYHRYIVDVLATESVAVRCIQVDSPSHLFLAGRSCIPTHNTLLGSHWVQMMVQTGQARRIAIVGPTASDVNGTMVGIKNDSGLIHVCPPWCQAKYEPSKKSVIWYDSTRYGPDDPNKKIIAHAALYSADEPDRLRGHNSDAAWCDEISSFRYPEAWHMLKLGLRIGKNPRCIITTTPKPMPWLRAIKKLAKTVLTKGSTYENKANLSAEFIEDIERQYKGTRRGEQEIEGKDLEDTPGALWNTSLLDELRVPISEIPERVRVVVAVDPSVADPNVHPDEDTAECGITVGAMGYLNHPTLGEVPHGYLLADRSLRAHPSEWAKAVVSAFDEFDADAIVAEANNGGMLVVTNIQTVRPGLPVNVIHASRGKQTRAEPISSLYAQRRIFHVEGQDFSEVESQMCTWVQGMKSPDRLDSLVWLFTELMFGGEPLSFGPHPFEDWR